MAAATDHVQRAAVEGGMIASAAITAADAYSLAVDMRTSGKASFQLDVANTNLVGVIYFQESNDGVTWSTITFDDDTSSITCSSGVAINVIRHIESWCAFLRVFFDYTSGAGSWAINCNKLPRC